MPRVEAPGAAVGRVTADAVLAVGAIDALCEQMVSGADDDGDVLVLCGTTLIVWVTIPEARQVPGLWTIPTMTGKSQIGGASNAGGLFLGWVDRVLGPGDPAAADPRRVPVWSPYLRGERTPFHDPDRRGMLDGLDLTHDAAALRRAAYEASGFVVRQLIELSGAERVADRGRRWRYPGRSRGCRPSPTPPAGRCRCPGWPRARRWARRSWAGWRWVGSRRSPTPPGGPPSSAWSSPSPAWAGPVAGALPPVPGTGVVTVAPPRRI